MALLKKFVLAVDCLISTKAKTGHQASLRYRKAQYEYLFLERKRPTRGYS